MESSNNKQTILIVDDAPANIKVLGEALKTEYQILVATNAEKALQIATSATPPDLILMDIIMPGMDGYEACKRLKQEEQTRNIPVVFITAKDQEEDETYGLELGAVDYITKPFSLPIVKARVKTHLELKRHRDILEKLSTCDGLTGIPNRRRFEEMFGMEWKRSIRQGRSLSLIMIDIDYFKLFNDHYGHLLGDDCLKLVAETLLDTIRRSGDFVARYGGEEFVCVLPETDKEGAKTVAELFRKAVDTLKIIHEKSQVSDHVTISLGVATLIPKADKAMKFLIEAADKSLYQAKAEGRNRIISVDLDLEG
jgi:diguanylate cyclase (GGDEF)-like protein